MSVVKRFNPLKNLDELDVLIDDVNTSSHIVITDMPQSLPQGKSSFLIETGPYMREGIELVFDFVDSEGNSIYLEPVSDYLEGTSRRVSVEVYSDTAPGPANIIVVGELDEIPTAPGLFAETDPVPEEFQGVYNIRLTREVIINPVAVNTQPIRFYTQPRVSINERRLGTMERTDPPDLITTNPFAVEGVPADGFGFKEFSTEEPKQGALAETNTKIVQSKGKTGKFSRMKKSFKAKKGKRKFSFFKRAGHIAKRNSPEAFPFSFKTSAHSFNTKEIDGKIILTSIDTTKYNQSQFNELKLTFPPTLNNTHTMSIEDVGNSATAFVTKPFTQTNADGQEIILPFFGNAKTRFEPPPTASYSTVNVMSYADVSITNMRTFSGDVFKAKVYVRPEGSFDDFKVLAELPVEASDLMVDLQSVGRGERTGYFENQADITKYWEKFGGTNGLSGGSTVASNFNNDILLDAVKLSGSLATFTDQMRFQQKSDYKFNLKAGLDYNLTFTAYAKKGTNKRALLIPYISGSGMYASPDEYSDSVTENKVKENSSYGKRLGSLEILPADDNEVDFKVVTTEFSPDRDGDGLVQFRVVDGEWYINDISVSPATDTGFSPSFFQFEKEMPSEYQHKRPETFEFMVEFYDPNNNIADSIAFNSGSVFNGANAFMSGNDNTMAGSLFIGGESTASGMHFGGVSSVIPETGGDGATGSGFMRSVGYQGFISASNPALAGTFGFMIYSGSVLPDSGDNYAGVGLELVGQSGSLKFRTNPSVFEVQADAFFVGKTTTQFISGSGGNIEISSSGLHITPEGNVTASAILLGDKANSQFLQFDDGQLTVQGNLSVDQIFTPALINGAASNVTNASSSITSQGFAKFTSASIAGFDVNTQAIVSSGSNLVMSQSGQITGSTVLFTGGKIGSFNLSNDAFTAGNTFFISSSVTNSQGFFISSSNFNIKAGGDVTGSNVNFVGGTIGGWSLGDSTITGGNLILNKAGSIRSSDYITDTSGFIISSEENGFAEFENVKIRGTLATTTFEKESVNAVGGQLFIANSAAMTGSSVPATGSKFRLKNVTGFTKGEILLIKKVGDTGFNTEYVKVVSASRTNDGGDDDPDGLAGDLFVERGTGYYVRAKKEYLANNDSNGVIRTYSATLPLKYATSVQNYDSGDANGFNVTGGHSHSGSFHIHVTGSVPIVGDGTALDLRVLNNSNSDSVIGTTRLWSLSDGVTQVDREIFHFHNTLTPIPTGSKIKMELVATTDGTDDSYLYLTKFTASLDYGTIGSPTLYGDASGSVGDPIGGPESYTEGQVLVSTGRYISGTGTNTVGTGYIRLNANPKNKATPYMDIVERTGSGIYDIELKARLGDLSGVAGTRNVPADFNGFGLMSEVAFLSGSQIKLEAPTFLLGDKNANFVSGSSGNIEISSSKFHVKPDGDIVVRKVDATEGSLGGFSIANNAISSSDGNININANTKAISINDTTFGNTGIQIEYNSGTPRTFIGKSTGANFNFDGTNLSVSASNFKVTSTGEVSASDMQLTGTSIVKNVSVADYFAYNNIVITTSNDHLYLETFTAQQYANGSYSTKTFWKLVLDGSLGGESGHVVTLDNLDAMVEYPIGCIVPPSQNNNANKVGTPPSSGFGAGHRIVIEVKNMDMYFTRNNSYHSNIDASSDVPTGYHIAADVDDMYSFGFSRTYTVSSTSYNNTLKVATGTRLEFLRGAADFKVQSISSLTGIGISSPGPTATFNTANTYLQSDGRSVAPFIIAGTPFLGGSGQGLGTLFLTSNKTVHADTSLYFGSTTRTGANQHIDGATNASCSLGMQSGGGNVFHNAVGQYKPTYIYEGGASTDAMMLGAAGGSDSNGNPNWPDSEFPLILRPNTVAFNAEFEHNYSQDFQTLRDFRIASGRDVRIKSNHNSNTQFGRYTFHVDADLGGVSVNRRFENSYTGRSFQAHHSSSAANLSGDYVALFQHDGNYASAHGITIQAGDDTNTGATTYIHFRDGDGGSIGAISSTGGNISYGTFTGVHEAYAVDSNGVINCAEDSLSGSIWPIGTVCSYVSSSLKYDKNGNVSPQPINYVATSSAYKDKRLYGVYFTGIAEEPRSGSFVYTNLYRPTGSSEGISPETKYGSMQQLNRDWFNVSSSRLEIPTGYVKKNTFDEFSDSWPNYAYVSQSIMYEGDVEDRRQNLHNIAALGDAVIRVNNQGGNIEIGDYLTSSDTGGVACKQDDDLLHNYTIAKSTQNVDFSQVSGSEIKIACTLHAG